MDPLANAVWHALGGPQRSVALTGPGAARFDPDVSVFAAVPDEPDAGAWSALAALDVAADVPLVLFRERVDLPEGWTVLRDLPGVQLLAEGLAGARSGRVVVLGPEDVPAMNDLVRRTRPGPFRPRTPELGTYVGIREGDRLVAMAGQRLHLPGRREISAVCTDPEHRRRGLARELVDDLVARTAADGERAFLHVAADNAGAIALYRSMGLVATREVTALVVRPPATPPG